jgi:phage-related protein
VSLARSLSTATASLSRFRGAAGQASASARQLQSSAAQSGRSLASIKSASNSAHSSLGASAKSTTTFKTSLDHLKSSSAKANTALRDVKRQSDSVEKTVGKAGKSATGSGKSMGGLGKGLKGATLAQKGLNTAMKANAFGLIMSLLAPLISQFINMDKVSAALAKGVKWAWNAIYGAVKNHAGPIKSVMKGIINAFTALPRAYISGLNAMIGALNRIHVKIPGWVPHFGGREFGIHLPMLPNIPTLAQGGIVPARTGGTLALVGEAGESEAVIPLSRLERMLGSGGGMRRLAAAVEALAERPVQIDVDSQTIARAVLLGQRKLARR